MRAAQIESLTLRLRDGSTAAIVSGEPTPIRGVVLAPGVVDVDRFSGYWHLHQVATGRAINPYGYKNIGDCRELARRLAKVADDWTALSADTSTWPEDIRTGVVEVLIAHRNELISEEAW